MFRVYHRVGGGYLRAHGRSENSGLGRTSGAIDGKLISRTLTVEIVIDRHPTGEAHQ